MILVQGFWLPRIKIIQFTGGFRPNFRDLTIILDTHLTFLTPKKEEYFIRGWRSTRNIVCYTAVFSVVTQRSSPQTAVCGEERCVTTLKTAV